MTDADHAASRPPPRSDSATLVAAGTSGSAYAVSPHFLASHAALEVMGGGGNAVDGAIAANAVQGVVAPDTCGIGGDLFALIHRPGGNEPRVLNSSGRAGSGASADELRRSHREMPYRHPWTITVPGCVAGWDELAATAGKLPLRTSLRPAIELARSGFPVSAELARSLGRIRELLGTGSTAAALYPEGGLPSPGTTLRRPGLARTLEAIADRGRDAFYRGSVATHVAEATQGGLTPEDMAAMQADWMSPIGIDVYGVRGWTVPPNSQGYVTLAAAWLLEQMAPAPDPEDPGFVHAAIEAYRAVAWERDDLVADPDHAPIEPAELLAPARLGERLAMLSGARTAHWPSPSPAPGGTAFLCVRDSSGMGVSLIQSNFAGIGSGISAGDTGIFLHNRGAGFNLTPGHPNELAPGKRPLHTLSPTLWTADGELRLLLGTRGGQFQPQLLHQVAAHLLHSDAPRAASQTHPRWQVTGWAPGEDPAVTFEAPVSEAILSGLRHRGHRVARTTDWQEGWGPVSLIAIGEDVFAAADPRVSTTAALASE